MHATWLKEGIGSGKGSTGATAWKTESSSRACAWSSGSRLKKKWLARTHSTQTMTRLGSTTVSGSGLLRRNDDWSEWLVNGAMELATVWFTKNDSACATIKNWLLLIDDAAARLKDATEMKPTGNRDGGENTDAMEMGWRKRWRWLGFCGVRKKMN